uniref:Uncharacterized protein n=1 Tax=Anguilla anguilla TaxID=7936 RepID=A0A0E9VPU5_ANGAN
MRLSYGGLVAAFEWRSTGLFCLAGKPIGVPQNPTKATYFSP